MEKKRGRRQKNVDYRKKRKRSKGYSKLYSKEEDQKSGDYRAGELETLVTENSKVQTRHPATPWTLNEAETKTK